MLGIVKVTKEGIRAVVKKINSEILSPGQGMRRALTRTDAVP